MNDSVQECEAPETSAPGDSAVPQVSIGIPVFNGEDYLAESLDSLLSQTFRNFEIVISDNGSTDGTEEICRDYAQRDPRVRYFREADNKGVSWNFNRVFELSRGDYFKWAASDDICAPEFLSRCVDMLDNDPSVVCCHTKTQKISHNGEKLVHLADPTDGGVAPGKHRPDASSPRKYRRFLDVLLSIGWSSRSFGVIRADCLRRTKLIQPYYGWEKVLMAELSLMGRFHDVPETLFYQRVHADAASNLRSVEEQQEFVDPSVERQRVSPRFRLLQGHLAAIWRHPLTVGERVLCLACVVRYLFQVSKWKDCVAAYYHGTGIGGRADDELESVACADNRE